MVAYQAGKTREDEAGSFPEEPNASSASSNRLAEVYDFAGVMPGRNQVSSTVSHAPGDGNP